ncbi:Polycomb protein Su(z)12 [Clonorchis sinensis]|uniref:Polycomb protein Su(Z)12 n=2 Tax=Clonorchis sinensis TaxID=79923 RepID=A0A3R7D9F2_CLOSI|nr:Polycomb protein Su(z)12 [Clonorchis sinensis]
MDQRLGLCAQRTYEECQCLTIGVSETLVGSGGNIGLVMLSNLGLVPLMDLTDEHSIEISSTLWEQSVPRRLSDILSRRKSTTNATPGRKSRPSGTGRRATITEARSGNTSPRSSSFRKLETRLGKQVVPSRRTTPHRKQVVLSHNGSPRKRTYVRRTPSCSRARASSKPKRHYNRSLRRPPKRQSCTTQEFAPAPSTDAPIPELAQPAELAPVEEANVPVQSPGTFAVRRPYTRRKVQPVKQTRRSSGSVQYRSSKWKLKRLGKSIASETTNQENHEAFVKAFAIPTHLYRYLAIRHRERPLYLNRTLSYLRSAPLSSDTRPTGKTSSHPRPSVNSVAERILRERHQPSGRKTPTKNTNNAISNSPTPELSPLTRELTPLSAVLPFWPQEVQLIFEGFFDSVNELDWVTVEASVGLYFRFGWAWRHKPCATDTLVAPFVSPFHLPCHNPGISLEPSRNSSTFDPDISCRFQPVTLLSQAKWLSSSGRLNSGQLELRVSAIERRWLKRPDLYRPNGAINGNGSLGTVNGASEKANRLNPLPTSRKGGLSSAAYPVHYTTAPLPLFCPNPTPVSESPPFLLTPGLYELRLGVDHGDHESSDKPFLSGDPSLRRNGLENGHHLQHETGSTADSVATSTSDFPAGTVSSVDEVASLNEAGAVSGRVEWRRIRFPKCSDVLDEYSRWPKLKFRVVWSGKASDHIDSPVKLAEQKKCEQYVNGWGGVRNSPLRGGTPVSPLRKNSTVASTRGIIENGLSHISPQVPKFSNKTPVTQEAPVEQRSQSRLLPPPPLSQSPARTRRLASTRPHLPTPATLPLRPVTYRFLYMNRLQQWSEAKDLVCPWCRLDCWRARERGPEALLVHLRTCHPRFRFKASWSPSRAHLSLEVSLNEAYDGSNDCGLRRWGFPSSDGAASRRLVAPGQLIGGWTGLGSLPVQLEQQQPTASLSLSTYASRVSRPVRRLSYTHLIFWRGAERITDQPLDPTLSVRPVALGHNRVYYHTRSVQPLRACEFDHDSEAEDAPEWLRQHYQRKVEEFTDVNQGEKQLMQLWNALLLSIGPSELVVCDSQLANLAACFVQRYASSIHRRHLRNNLILHFANLVDYGLLSPGQLRHLVTMYDKIVCSSTPGRVQLPPVTA